MEQQQITQEHLCIKIVTCSYIHIKAHRNSSPQKSQWTINRNEEVAIFHNSIARGWILKNSGWGLYMPNGTPAYLGIDKSKSKNLFIAKFVSKNSNFWHGYPADYTRRPQDVPHEEVINSWIRVQLFSKAKARKILRGQKCNL